VLADRFSDLSAQLSRMRDGDPFTPDLSDPDPRPAQPELPLFKSRDFR
jgi:hypothetical protein